MKTSRRIFAYALVAGLILFGSSRSVLAENAVKVEPFRGLVLRGINVILGGNKTEEDYRKMHDWKVNSIRLELQADHSRKDDGLIRTDFPLTFSDEGFAKVRQQLDLAHKYGMFVVIDLHSTPGKPEGLLWQDFKYWDTMIGLWREIATRFGRHPAVIGYDLLNEPSAAREERGKHANISREGWEPPASWKETPRDYDLLMRRVTDAIRQVDKKTTIIVEGGWAGGMPISLKWQKPTGDLNTVYSFHMYQPRPFTYQGSPEQPENKIGVRYPSGKLSKEGLLAAMKPALDFSEKYHVPLYVGEFSTSRFSEPYGGPQWLEDVLEFFESHGWHWAYHCYGTGTNWNAEFSSKPGDNSIVPGGTPRLAVLKKYWGRGTSASKSQ